MQSSPGRGRRAFKALIAMALCAVICFSVFPVQSAEFTYSSGYTSGIFYHRLTNVSLTGDQRADIVNVALSQVGYTEGNNSSSISGLAQGKKNYTEYGLWYEKNVNLVQTGEAGGFERAAWCATFVSWCAAQAGISSSVVYYHAYTPYGYSWYNERGLAYSRAQVLNGEYTPQPGDIVYFSSSSSKNVNHVGIVIQYADGVLYTVEGNTNSGENTNDGGAVCLKSYALSNTYIRYVCCPNYK